MLVPLKILARSDPYKDCVIIGWEAAVASYNLEVGFYEWHVNSGILTHTKPGKTLHHDKTYVTISVTENKGDSGKLQLHYSKMFH